jgi:uncharacterized protein with HEPN domain
VSRDSRAFLGDIERYASAACQWVAGKSEEGFLSDEILYNAVLHHLEVIGEAVKRLPPEIRALDPDVPWSLITGFRDVAAHAYFQVEPDVVWDVVSRELPELLARVQAISVRLASREG